MRGRRVACGAGWLSATPAGPALPGAGIADCKKMGKKYGKNVENERNSDEGSLHFDLY